MALKVSKHGTIKYDDFMAERMRDRVEAASYLNACLEDEDPRVFLIGVRHVVDANGGVAAVARKTGLNREHLFKMLSSKGNPRLENLLAILIQLGFKPSIGLAPPKKKAVKAKSRPSTKRRRAA